MSSVNGAKQTGRSRTLVQRAREGCRPREDVGATGALRRVRCIKGWRDEELEAVFDNFQGKKRTDGARREKRHAPRATATSRAKIFLELSGTVFRSGHCHFRTGAPRACSQDAILTVIPTPMDCVLLRLSPEWRRHSSAWNFRGDRSVCAAYTLSEEAYIYRGDACAYTCCKSI